MTQDVLIDKVVGVHKVTFATRNAVVNVGDVTVTWANTDANGNLTFETGTGSGYNVVRVYANPWAQINKSSASSDTYTITGVSEETTLTVIAAKSYVGTEDVTVAADYEISMPAQLVTLATKVNNKAFASPVYTGSNFYLTDDISLSGYDPWTPIGGEGLVSAAGVPEANAFGGVFDGYNPGTDVTHENTFTISGLNIPATSFADANGKGGYGLFGYVDGGEIRHLTVSGTISDGTDDPEADDGMDANLVGGIVGYTNGTLYNLHNEVNVIVNNSAASQTGGVAGCVENPVAGSKPIYVQYCSNIGTVMGRGRVSGIVGAVYCANIGGVVVDRCFDKANLTTVKVQQKCYAGGIVGYCRGFITNSYTNYTPDPAQGVATFTTTGGHYIAGVVGLLQGDGPEAALSNVYSNVDFEGVDDSSGSASDAWDHFIFASADKSTTLPIANALYVNTNPQHDIDHNEVNLDQPRPNTGPWGYWTQVGWFTSPTTTRVYTSSTNAETTPSTTSVLNAPPIVGETGGNAFTTPSANAYPELQWQQTPSAIGPTPDIPGEIDTDDTSQIFLDVTAEDPPLGVYNNLADALNALNTTTTGQTIIYVKGDAVPISSGTVSITSGISGATIKRSSTYDGYLFDISGGAVSISNITIDGNIKHIGAGLSLINISAGSLTIGTGAVLQNNLAGEGGAISATGGTVTLSGGTIQGNYASMNLILASPGALGGAIYINGATVNINSGDIIDNQATSHVHAEPAYGGAIYLGSGNLTVTGGSITGNIVDGGMYPENGLGSGVYVAGGTFTITPSTPTSLEYTDVTYLTNGKKISVGATVANITGKLTVQVQNPDDDVPVAEGSGYQLQRPNDLEKFAYYQDFWLFYLSGNVIFLESV